MIDPDAGPPLDEGGLRELLEMIDHDPVIFDELVDVFLEHAPQLLAEVRAGAEAGDAKLLGRSVHTLKGSSSNFGAVALPRLCVEIQRLAAAGALAEAGALLPRLEAALGQFIVALGAHRSALEN